jgi:hypothetical protein
VDHSTRDQSEFWLDFRVPFPLFDEDIVKECKDFNTFTIGRKKATICVEFKVRILERNYVTAFARELLGAAAKTAINDFLKLFLRNCSLAY